MSFILSTRLVSFEVRLKLYDRPVSLLDLLSRVRLTPQRHRQADGQIAPRYPPLAKFPLVWRHLYEPLRSSSSLVRRSDSAVSSSLKLLVCKTGSIMVKIIMSVRPHPLHTQA